MVRLAVVGTGWQGQGHLNTLKTIEGVKVAGVCDMNPQMLAKAAEKFGLPAYADYADMLERAKPDGVVICTPPEARVELVREAASRGIHCFIEKPPAKTAEMAAKVEGVLADSPILHSVGFMFRYSRAVDRCRELLAGKRVALVRSAMLDGIALRPNWPRWFFDKSRSGGPIFDQAIHMIDLSRYILGEISRVSGFQGNLTVPKSDDFTVEDSFSLALQYESGVLQNHTHSWAYSGFLAQLEFISDELHLTLDLGKGTVRGTIGGEAVSFDSDDALYKLELEAFAQAVRTGDRSLIRSSYGDSVLSLSAALAAVRAVESGTVERVG